MNNTTIDPTKKVSAFLDHILKSLDTQTQPNLILPQLHQAPRIIINGEPFASRDQFQKIWLNLPQSQHQVTSFDTHLLPSNSNQYIVMTHIKVKFDESGYNKLGQSSNFNNQPKTKSNWSKSFGVVLTLIVDSSINQNFDHECISSWDYRFTSKPDHSLFNIL